MSTRPDQTIDYDYYRGRAAQMRSEAIQLALTKGFSRLPKLRAMHYFGISFLVTTIGLLSNINHL